jgi:hypothetical protein
MTAFEKVYGTSYEEEKERTIKELKALYLRIRHQRKQHVVHHQSHKVY